MEVINVSTPFRLSEVNSSCAKNMSSPPLARPLEVFPECHLLLVDINSYGFNSKYSCH